MKKIFCLLFIVVCLFGVQTVHAEVSDSMIASISVKRLDGGVTITDSYCSNENFLKPFRLLGRVFSVIKILIPVIILTFGVVDFFKAVIASKDDEIKKATKSLLMRIIAGVIIFFLPAIVHFIFRLIDDWQNYETDYSKCSLCITEPNKC